MDIATHGLPLQTENYIDGKFMGALDGARMDVVSPATGEIATTVASGGDADVDLAVKAAYREYSEGAWSKMNGIERGRLLYKLADLIERDADILARMESLDNGKLFMEARMADMNNVIGTFRYFAGYADKLDGRKIEVPGGAFGRPVLAYTIREPLGVIGGIGAYNAPSMFIGWKAAPALAAGNTIVMKPAEEAPLTTLYVAKLFEEAGFPAGVFNVVSGRGPVAGMALVRHPLVAKVSYTGSGNVGRVIAKEAAEHLKPLILELGGKAPQIVLQHADLEKTLPVLAMAFFANQGQICAAGTRILVHRSRVDEVVAGLKAAAESQKVGDPFDPTSTMGPLATAKSVDRVMGYVEHGKADGAKLIAGGTRPQGFGKGFYVNPTVFLGDNSMKIAQEEIFGPVGTIIPFDTTEEAIRIANDTVYGLNASVFTNDISEANLIAAKLQTGAVWINGFGLVAPSLPWGGVKASGYGRETGYNGLLELTHEKVVTTLL